MPRFKIIQALIPSTLKRRITPFARWGFSRVLTFLGMVVQSGGQPVDPRKPTALVVSHEASTTGAPILALNLARELGRSHNVVVLLLNGGPLKQQFQSSSTALIEARRSFVNRKLVKRALRKASPDAIPIFALVNSVVSAPLLEPLRGEGIACLSLVHEFVTYIKPLDVFSEVGLWSSRVVCSTPLTWGDVLRQCNHLTGVPLVVLPQGRCQLPEASSTIDRNKVELQTYDPTEKFLRQLPKQTLLVLGAGAVQPRKGVDLFIAVAAQIKQQVPELDVQFAWIGSGYAPDHDFNVSAWLKDQIIRSGLDNDLFMLPASPAYSELIHRSNLFIVSSRLDPLPNVAIDAMLEGSPVLCFAEATGFGNLFKQDPDLYRSCVASYFDIHDLALKSIALLHSPQRLKQIGELSRKHAQRWFDMNSYVKALISLGKDAAEDVVQENSDIKSLLESDLIDRDFHTTNPKLSDLVMTQRYALAWRSSIQTRKPCPGFHPGIYREQQSPAIGHRDPLAHWYQKGQPSGPWKAHIINSSTSTGSLPSEEQVALHIHVFYPELLDSILQLLNYNSVHPTLFLSFSDPSIQLALERKLQNYDFKVSMHLVPNRGRDIGPLLSELGKDLDSNYLFHGHLHTKKSVLVDGGIAARWRSFLMTNLLGSAENPMLDRIASSMVQDPQLGLVFPDDPGCLGWTANRKHAETLAHRLGIENLPEAINFPVGTMFWARQGALSKLYDLGLKWEDYPDEPIGYDGTMLHAIERLLPQICLASDMSYAMTHVPGISR
jgi:glycosyltransferase involved in cell wall biosynthesis